MNGFFHLLLLYCLYITVYCMEMMQVTLLRRTPASAAQSECVICYRAGMLTVKLCSNNILNNILQFLDGVPVNTGYPV